MAVSTTTPKKRRIGRIVLGGVAAIVVVVAGLVLALRHGRPEVVLGDGTELARAVERAVNAEAWQRTGAVRWTWTSVVERRHLWDRQRQFLRVAWKDKEVLYDLHRRDGVVYVGGQVVRDEAQRREVLDRAWAFFCNDSFWLNPLVKLFDDGVTRERVQLDGGGEGLYIRYASGGITPGDAYLWIPGADGKPKAWRLWVKLLPIPGLEMSWEGWQTLSTGAVVATEHRVGGFGPRMRLDGVAGAATLAELVPGSDPFVALVTFNAEREGAR